MNDAIELLKLLFIIMIPVAILTGFLMLIRNHLPVKKQGLATVKSTFLGTNLKWLTSILVVLFGFCLIEANFTYFKVSLFPVLVVFIVLYLVAVFWAFKAYLKKIDIFVAALIMIISSTILWFSMSYNSYYTGVMREIKREARIYYKISSAILMDNDLPESKREKLQAFAGKRKNADKEENMVLAKIVITAPDGSVFYSKASDRGSEYIAETIIDKKSIETATGTYKFSFIYNNRPYITIGLTRAITLSIIPDAMINGLSWQEFMNKYYYERSYNFWIPALLFWLGILIFFHYWRQSKIYENMLKAKTTELENFQNAYDKIRTDFSAGVSNSENNLQGLVSATDSLLKNTNSWEQDFKNFSGSGRHDVLNRIAELRKDQSVLDERRLDSELNKKRLVIFKQALMYCFEDNKQFFKDEQEFLNDVYNFIFRPWIEKIHVELKSLDELLDITVSTCPMQAILQTIREAIPKNLCANANATDVYFTTRIADDINLEGQAKVIISKVKSIVYNLIANSAAATSQHLDVLINAGDFDKISNYRQKINLLISEAVVAEQHYLCIEVNDNGGGFPEDILGKIYKEQIRTTKNSRRYGKGTTYIAFFVSLMKGCKIEAANIINEEGEKGASTKFYIPYVNNEEE